MFKLDLHEAADLSSAYGALIGLHSNDLRALDAEAHVSAGEDNCILGSSVADNTFLLGVICNVCSIIVYSVNVVQVKYFVVILKGFVRERNVTRNLYLISLNFRVSEPSN